MIIEKIELKESTEKSCDFLNPRFNLITSNDKNSTGKSTYCRLIFYSLGYPIPSTEDIKFEKVESKTQIVNDNGNRFIIHRKDKSLSLYTENDNLISMYTLPEEHTAFLSYIFDIDDFRIIKNLLGLMYIDQEKGWTLLNRGKVIGGIHFSIDELMAALNHTDCESLFEKRDLIENEINKYNAMLNMNSIKEEYYENNNNLEIVSMGEDIKKRIASLQLLKQSLNQSIKEIEKVIRQDKNFFEYIESMNLYIKTESGSVRVTKDNIENSCNIEFLKAEKLLLKNNIVRLDTDINKLNRELNSLYDNNLFNENETVNIEKSINIALSNINIDIDAIKNALRNLKSELSSIKYEIKIKIRNNNKFITKMYNLLLSYAKQLHIENYISAKEDYIFTNNLKSKTGALFQKLIIAFKTAAIKTIEDELGIKLLLVIDSPKSKEIGDENTKLILNFLKKEFADNQVIIASIYSEKQLFVDFDAVFSFNNRAIESR